MKEVKSMSQIDYEQDRVQSVTQADAAKSLSDKVIELKNLEDEIANAEKSVSKLKEQAKTLSQFEIPTMMEEMPCLLCCEGDIRKGTESGLHSM